MIEPLIHLLFCHPFQKKPRDRISDKIKKASVIDGVPGIAIVIYSTHHPGASPGTEDYLYNHKRRVEDTYFDAILFLKPTFFSLVYYNIWV